MSAEFDKDKILNRVKKMITLANDAAASEGERDNALRMAHATLAKYNLSMGGGAAAAGKTPEKSTHPWERMVASAVATLFFCRYIYSLRAGKETHHYFIGRESNVYTSQEMFKYLVSSINREAKQTAKAQTGNDSGNYWRSFCKGAAYSVQKRCQQIHQDAEHSTRTPGTALVLASLYQQEQEANQSLIAQIFGKLRTTKSRTRGADSEAFGAGQEYGKKVSLNNQIGGPSTKSPRLN